MNEAFEKWIADQDKYNPPTHKEAFRAGMLAAAEMERSKGNDKSTRSVPEDDRNNGIKQLGHIRTHPMDE